MAHYRVGDDLYDMDPTTWSNVDVSSVQRALGCGVQAFMDRIESMDVDAIQAMIWVLRRRKDPSLRLDDVVFTIREFMDQTEVSDADIPEVWPRLDAMQREGFFGQLTEDQRTRLFDADGELIVVEAAVPLAQPAADVTEI